MHVAFMFYVIFYFIFIDKSKEANFNSGDRWGKVGPTCISKTIKMGLLGNTKQTRGKNYDEF